MYTKIIEVINKITSINKEFIFKFILKSFKVKNLKFILFITYENIALIKYVLTQLTFLFFEQAKLFSVGFIKFK